MARADRLPTEELWQHASDGVIARSRLRSLGWDVHSESRQVQAGRWVLLGRRSVALHTGPVGAQGRQAWAVLESGTQAALDGLTALQAWGLTRIKSAQLHVSIPHRTRIHRTDGVVVHGVHRVPDELYVPSEIDGPARVGVPVAAIRAATWAASDRQAALMLVAPVQQRLTTGRHLQQAAEAMTFSRRRQLIATVVADVADGAQALGELNFARLSRAYGLPEPERQVVCRGPAGRLYLDVRYKGSGLVVEVDGAQHYWGLAPVDDLLRQNALVIEGGRVLRVPVLGLRLTPDPFMRQVVTGYYRFAA